MNITEKMVERALDRWADTSDGEGGLHRMRAALEAAFAAVEVIPGTDVFAAAEKESEVMPPDGQRNVRANKTTTPATSPGGAIAGASAVTDEMAEPEYILKCVNGHDRCYEGPDENCPYCERIAPPPQNAALIPDGYRLESVSGEWRGTRYYGVVRLVPIEAPPVPSPDEVERALIAFNESWGEFALDGTERCRTAMRAALAAAAVPSPDEVERVAAAIRYEDDCGLTVGSDNARETVFCFDKRASDEARGGSTRDTCACMRLARAVIAATNRAPQPSYDDGQPYKDLLKDLVDLHSEEWVLTCRGPGITERWEKAWVAAAELLEG